MWRSTSPPPGIRVPLGPPAIQTLIPTTVYIAFELYVCRFASDLRNWLGHVKVLVRLPRPAPVIEIVPISEPPEVLRLPNLWFGFGLGALDAST